MERSPVTEGGASDDAEAATEERASAGDGEPGWRRALTHPLTAAGAVGSLCLLLAARTYGMLGRTGLVTPLTGQADELQHALLADAMQKHGWYLVNPSLGAPHELNLADFPLGGDNVTLFLLKLVSLLPVGPFTALNVTMLLTFALVGAVAYLVLLTIGVRRWSAAVAAVLYSVLPYHFIRGTGHVLLSNYVAAPLGLLLLHWLVSDGLVPRSPGRRRLVGLAVVVVVLGGASPYYATFTVLLLVAGGLLEAARRRRRRPALAALGVSAAVGVVLVLNLLPTFVNDLRNGDNVEAASRVIADSEALGLRISSLFTPAQGHRIGAFAAIADDVEAVAEASELGQYLGLVAGAGLVGLVVLVLLRAVGVGRDGPPLLPLLGALAIVAVGVATKGGGSLLIAVLVTNQVRAWNRMVVYLALFGLVAAAWAFDRWLRPRLSRPAAAAVLAAVVLVGLFDQLPLSPRPAVDVIAAELAVDRRYVEAMDVALPDGSMVYQLPYMRYPGSAPIEGMYIDHHFRLPLLDEADHLRFSFGAIRGRDGDWQEPLVGLSAGDTALLLAAAGFDAVSVDRAGYAQPDLVLAGLEAVAGPSAGTSETGRYAWFDLRDLRDEVRSGLDDPDAVAAALVAPPRSFWASGASESDGGYPASRALEAQAVLEVRNDGDGPVPARLVGTIEAEPQVSITVEVAGLAVDVRPGEPLDVEFELPPGTTPVTFTIDGGGTRARARAVAVSVADRRADPAWDLVGGPVRAPS